MKLNKKGFSLIELIAAIAIIAIVTSIIAIGITSIYNGDSIKARDNIKSSIELLRTNTMAIAADYYIEITNSNGKIIMKTYKNGQEYETKNLGSRISINLEYEIDDVVNTRKLDEEESVFIKFDRKKGSVLNFNLDGEVILTDNSIGDVQITESSFSGGINIETVQSVTFYIKGRKTKALILYLQTGLFDM